MNTSEEGMEIDGGVDGQSLIGVAGPSILTMEMGLPTTSTALPTSTISNSGQLPKIDENNVLADDDYTDVKRFTIKLDQLDDQIEKFRKEALMLQDKRDCLLTELDVIRNNQILANLNEYEDEQINCYVHRLNNRLGTIELTVKIVRDAGQEDSLHEINRLIDTLITSIDRFLARQRCQMFLNCFDNHSDCNESKTATKTLSMTMVNQQQLCEQQEHVIDKTFQQCLNGCTLDDQKLILKRLLALNVYLNKQAISE